MQASNSQNSQSFTDRLRWFRNTRGVGQAELGNLVNRRPSTISDWEKGRTQPSLAEIEILAKGLGVSPGRLAFGENQEPVESSKPEGPAEEAEARAEFETLLKAAAGNPSRIGWITEQLRQFLRVPAHWRIRPETSDPELEAYREERRAVVRKVREEVRAKRAAEKQQSERSA